MPELLDEIQSIIPPSFPFNLDKKIFKVCGCEDDCECQLVSWNERMQYLIDISGCSPDLLGSYKKEDYAKSI